MIAVSKTFKALQRAARERQEKSRQPEETPGTEEREEVASSAGGPAEEAGSHTRAAELPPDEPLVTARREPLPPPPATEAPVESSASPPPMRDEELRGEKDGVLQGILEEDLRGAGGALRVEADGWVWGSLDPEKARALLAKYALLHCLRRDESSSFWFWAHLAAARERSHRSGLPLDLEDLPRI